jgi:hypothetical protein
LPTPPHQSNPPTFSQTPATLTALHSLPCDQNSSSEHSLCYVSVHVLVVWRFVSPKTCVADLASEDDQLEEELKIGDMVVILRLLMAIEYQDVVTLLPASLDLHDP